MQTHILSIGSEEENHILRNKIVNGKSLLVTELTDIPGPGNFDYSDITTILIQESVTDKYLQGTYDTNEIPVIMLFSAYNENSIHRAYKKNVFDCVVKDSKNHYFSLLSCKLERATHFYLLSRDLLHKDKELAVTHERNEEKFQYFLDNLPLPVRIFNLKSGKNIFINKKFSEVYGYSLDDIPDNRTLYKKAYPDREYRKKIKQIYQAQISGATKSQDKLEQEPVNITCKNRTIKSILIKAVRVDENILLLSRDITKKLRVEKALIESEERMTKVVDTIPVLMSALDEEGNFIFWNREAEEVTGFSFEDIMNDKEKVLHSIYTPETYREIMDVCFGKSDKCYNWEAEITKKDGRKRIISWSNITRKMPIPGWGMWLFGFDITEQKEAEEALKFSEEKYRTIFEHANDAILILKEDIIVNCNKRTVQMLGCPFDQIIGRTLFDFSPYIQPDGSKSEDVGFKYIQKAINNIPLNFEWLMINSDARPFYTEISLYSIRIPDVDLVAIIHDISKRKEAIRAVKRNEKKYRLLIENQTDYITKLDRDGKYQFVSPSFCKLLGLKEKDLLGKHAYSFLKKYTHREDVDKTISAFMGLFNPPARIDIETRTISTEGIKWVSWTGRSVTTDKGDIDFIINVGRDITEKKKAEEESLEKERQLIQSEKMASLGVLISGIAHEINNPNNYILLNSKIIHKIWHQIQPILDDYYRNNPNLTIMNIPYIELKEQVSNIYEGLTNGADRIKNIVNSLKEFSQPDLGIWNQKIDVNNAIESSLLICNTIIKKSTDNLEITMEKNLPSLQGSLQQLEQVIINLIINACQALSSTKQKIRISSGYDKEKNYIQITVQDEGKGISEKDLHKIFDPFYTTKTETGGTGLGLSISYNIIKKFKGTIQFSSVENQGTTAQLILPLINNKGC